MAYTYNDGMNPTIPDGATYALSDVDLAIQDIKKAINERLNDVLGGDWTVSTNITVTKVGGAVSFNGTGYQATQPVVDLGNITGATVLDFDVRGNYIKATLTGSVTFSVSNMRVGTTYILMLKQNGTGGYGITWPSGVKWAGGVTPTLTTTANTTTFITLTPYSTSNAMGAVAGTGYSVS